MDKLCVIVNLTKNDVCRQAEEKQMVYNTLQFTNSACSTMKIQTLRKQVPKRQRKVGEMSAYTIIGRGA